ncbi:SNAP-25 ue, t-SNARE component Sec9 [Schizosaccharomyces japonicus yFS275]|uniref:SNAP-25 ue, t-SNARE component Sec9 n=1 Tax=Schizosaccharomyces japonicus (strain yFS275 / FY16936) TaxID=402676 RepID=B6JWP8_SCHJY|nr:SNAP-25 ue, t-SNARE component Sec9 [Schizosaccharomyces japonicus yFS275]EEB05799.1 SNAP-25 ue, t-SNARE component Sec9 [Schizosaccharomyces japonicus yFS275]
MKKFFRRKKGVSTGMYDSPDSQSSSSVAAPPSYKTVNPYAGDAYAQASAPTRSMNPYAMNSSSRAAASTPSPSVKKSAAYASSINTRESSRTASPELEQRKQELFRGARMTRPDPETASQASSQQGGYGYGMAEGRNNEYGAPSTYEEEEDEVNAIKDKMRFVKQDSLASTRNALQIAAQAEETGRATLNLLGQQTDKIANAEKELDLSRVHAKHATEQAAQLKTYNRSMFAIHVGKPWGKAKRVAQEEARLTAKREAERADEAVNRQFAYQSQQRVGRALQDNDRAMGKKGQRNASLTERARYQFEPDAEDDAVEAEIDRNLDQLGGIASRLRGLAFATGQEIDAQNSRLATVQDKSDQLDTDVYLNIERIRRIH